MAVELATNELSAVNDEPFRKLLISNFITIQNALNELLDYQDEIKSQLNELTTGVNENVDGKINAQDQAITDKLQAQTKQLTDRINRIILGTDHESLEIVVHGILKEEGVIK